MKNGALAIIWRQQDLSPNNFSDILHSQLFTNVSNHDQDYVMKAIMCLCYLYHQEFPWLLNIKTIVNEIAFQAKSILTVVAPSF